MLVAPRSYDDRHLIITIVLIRNEYLTNRSMVIFLITSIRALMMTSNEKKTSDDYLTKSMIKMYL